MSAWKKDKFPMLRSEREARRENRKLNFQICAMIIIPLVIFLVICFYSPWLQNLVGAENYHVTRAKITLFLLVVALPIFGLCKGIAAILGKIIKRNR